MAIILKSGGCNVLPFCKYYNTITQSYKNTYSNYINLNTSMTLKQPHPLGRETKTECVLAMAPMVG